MAHKLANNFAKEKALDLTKMFLVETGIIKVISEKEINDNSVAMEYERHIGKIAALSYAMGYLDGLEKQKEVTLFVPPTNPKTN